MGILFFNAVFFIDSSNLASNALELLDKCGDPLEDVLLLGQVLRVQRAHFWQDAV